MDKTELEKVNNVISFMTVLAGIFFMALIVTVPGMCLKGKGDQQLEDCQKICGPENTVHYDKKVCLCETDDGYETIKRLNKK